VSASEADDNARRCWPFGRSVPGLVPMTDHAPPALRVGDPARDGVPASTTEPFSSRGGAPLGNENAVTHGGYSGATLAPRARELAEQTLAAHQHLDAAKDGPAIARYCTLLARIERVNEWLDAQADDVFSDREAGTMHAAHERLDRWNRQAEAAEHRLAIDPYTRSKLGLVQAQAFDLAAAMAEASADG